MNCNCNPANPAPYWAEHITLGNYSANALLNIYFETANGRTDIAQATCDGSGNIRIPNPFLRQNTPYTVWLALQSDATQTELQWHIADATVTCIVLEFDQEALSDIDFNPSNFTITLP